MKRELIDVDYKKDFIKRGKFTVVATDDVFPSGLRNSDVIGWDRFLAAWFVDFDKLSLDGPSTEALKIFILTWELKGKAKATVEMRVGERDEDVKYVELDEVPPFSYNPERKKVIEDLTMTYVMWKSAVGDFKLNTQGASDPELWGEAEKMQWGGPIDVSLDVKPISTRGTEIMNRFMKED